LHVYLLYSGIRGQFVSILKFDQLKYSTIRINNTDNELLLWPLHVHSSGHWHADFLLLHAWKLVNHSVTVISISHTTSLCYKLQQSVTITVILPMSWSPYKWPFSITLSDQKFMCSMLSPSYMRYKACWQKL